MRVGVLSDCGTGRRLWVHVVQMGAAHCASPGPMNKSIILRIACSIKLHEGNLIEK